MNEFTAANCSEVQRKTLHHIPDIQAISEKKSIKLYNLFLLLMWACKIDSIVKASEGVCIKKLLGWGKLWRKFNMKCFY